MGHQHQRQQVLAEPQHAPEVQVQGPQLANSEFDLSAPPSGSDTPFLDRVDGGGGDPHPEAGLGLSGTTVQMDDGEGGRVQVSPTGFSVGSVTQSQGDTEQLSVGIDGDRVTGSYSQKYADGSGFGVGGQVHENGGGLSANNAWANGARVGVKGSFAYDGDVSHTVSTGNRADPISQLLDPGAMDGVRANPIAGTAAGGYHLDGRKMSWSVGGSADYKKVGVSGGFNGSSEFNVFTAADAGLDADQAHAQNRAILETAGGIADLGMFQDPDNLFGPLAVGQGVNWQSKNGWNAGVKGSYGALGLGVGKEGSSQHAVTMLRTGEDSMQLSVKESDMQGFSLTPSVAGVELGLGSTRTQAQTLTFDVDATQLTPESQAELSTFLATGLLPGASQLSGEQAEADNATFADSRGQIDAIDAQLAALDARYADATEAERQAMGSERERLVGQRLDSSAAMDEARVRLNATWREQNQGDADIGIPGVTLNRDERSTTDGSTGSVAGVDGLGMKRNTTWTETAYQLSGGQMGTEHRYRDEHRGNWFVNPKFDETSANTEGRWQMGSQLDVRKGSNEASIVDDIALSTLPDYLQAGVRDGTLPWDTLEEAQVVLSLDEPTVMALGDALSEGEAGEALWAGMSDRASALFTVADRLQNGVGALGHGAEGIYSEWYARGLVTDHDAMSRSAGGLGHTAQTLANGEYIELMPRQGMSQIPAGMTPGEVATVFSGITGPESFQALRESHPDSYRELQSLYIDAAVKTAVETNPYEAVAAITLIEDPEARAAKLTEVFAALQGDLFDQIGGGAPNATQNPTLQFIELAQRASLSDPELRAAIDASVTFNWAPERTRELQGKPPAEIAAALTGARDAHSGGFLGLFSSPDVDEVGAVEALWAANNSNALPEVLAASGMAHTEILDMLKDNPSMQRMAGDMLGAAGFPVDQYAFADAP